MKEKAPSGGEVPLGRVARFSRSLNLWYVLAFSLLFLTVALFFSSRIMRAETTAATTRLKAFTAGASRHLESQFEGLHDDFRLLVSLDAFHSYQSKGDTSEESRRNQALVRRFFARHQEWVDRITVDLRDGGSFDIRILPGNYLSVSQVRPIPSQWSGLRTPRVRHEGEFLVLSEWLPKGMDSPVAAGHLVVRHREFLRSGLESYLMGQSDLWIWSIRPDFKPDLIRHPLSPERSSTFRVTEDSMDYFRQLLDDGLEGIRAHEVFFPEPRKVISVFNPVSLAGVPMGLVFSTEEERHLASLHRLSGFLLAVFLGAVVLMGTWFGITYARIRKSEEAEVTARREAELATRVKSDFVAAMSHEIRTPLHGVLGYAGLLKQSGLDGEQQRHIDIVLKCGDHLLTLLNDILDFSRLEAGALKLRHDEFSPAAMVAEVVELLSSAAQGKGLTFEERMDPGVPAQVRGDGPRVRQVLFNLVGNAIKFTQQGGVSIRVQRGERQTLRFEVVDTGIGVDPEQRELLFSPFSQIDRSSSRSYEGSGLGLAICKRIVDQMGGMIDFTSEPGKGSGFFFEIRLPEVPEGTAPVKPGGRILWIGGEPDARLLHAVDELGATLRMVTDSADAVHEMRSTRPTLVVSMGEGPWDEAVATAARSQSPPVPCVWWPRPGADDRFEKDPAAWLIKAMEGASTEGSPAAPPADPPAESSGEVMIVDDNEVNRSLLGALLKRQGLQVVEAGGGLEALHRSAEISCRLIFMDVEMPGMDGLEVTRRIRAEEEHQGRHRAVIIGLSAHAFSEDREVALAAGMDDYLAKPITPAELDRVVRLHWGGAGDAKV
ncbi:signal transduction histidine kinase/CheY-like chemotaxis protein [Haloferula luteola]|uniref:histidine kinase n=1 Tax=Haloferula luteola TaxID=595692 RepID=A0A840V319_9BACT|nr:ATP-binding protein [Haloferula luteola]MBB5352697.1 signal transduction histidine kinase/CheY-like chemotaxis protein [Haloferula luteola]